MALIIACPECEKQLQVPEDLLGSTVQCPECRHTFTAELSAPKPPPMASARKKTSSGASTRTRRNHDDDDLDPDERPSRRSIRRDGDGKPAKVANIGVLCLIGGIFSILVGIGWGGASCCLWPPLYYSLVLGILAIVKGTALLGTSAQDHAPPIYIGVMLIINIINADIVSVVLGILVLVFCSDEEVKAYLRG
jgi:hypothetical protein